MTLLADVLDGHEGLYNKTKDAGVKETGDAEESAAEKALYKKYTTREISYAEYQIALRELNGGKATIREYKKPASYSPPSGLYGGKKTGDASTPWFADVVMDPIQEALVQLFCSKTIIKDHQDLHALAEQLGVEPSDMEERAYAMLQAFFSQGRYMKEGQDKTFDSDELSMGDGVELEHTNDPVIARRIALDHLTELPDYYTRLKAMEQGAKTGDGKEETT